MARVDSPTGPPLNRRPMAEVMADLPDDGDAGLLLRDALQRLAVVRR